jgi:hypothetical protein
MVRRRTKRSRSRGGYYGYNGSLATGAPNWTASSEMGDWSISTRGANATYGSSRSRRSHRRKTRRSRVSGAGKFGAVSASFQGTGQRGIIDVVPVNTKGYPGTSA